MSTEYAQAHPIGSPATGDVIGWRITCEQGHTFTTNDAHAPAWFLRRHRAATHRDGCAACGSPTNHPPRLHGPSCPMDESGSSSVAFLAALLMSLVPVGMLLWLVAGLVGMADGVGVA